MLPPKSWLAEELVEGVKVTYKLRLVCSLRRLDQSDEIKRLMEKSWSSANGSAAFANFDREWQIE